MTTSLSRRLAVSGPLVLFLLAPVHAADPPGILWESTSQMVMQGMPFSPPPQKAKYCAATSWTKPPPGGDTSCVNTDFKVVGNTASWKMECKGQMPMTGTGEITFDGTDAYTGQINATSEGVNVTIKLAGKKIGTCEHPQ